MPLLGNSPCYSNSLFEFQHHDLRIRAQAKRRSPGARAARSEHLHPADAAQGGHKLAVDAATHPPPWNELPEMRVAGQLQREAGRFRNFRMIRSMDQQNA